MHAVVFGGIATGYGVITDGVEIAWATERDTSLLSCGSVNQDTCACTSREQAVTAERESAVKIYTTMQPKGHLNS